MATKKELIAKISESLSMSKKDSELVLDSVVDAIKTAAAEDGQVQLTDFITITVKNSPAHTGRNPKNGEPVAIPEKNVINIKAGKGFKDLVNS